MRAQNQLLAVATAVLFAIVVALTVTVISLSTVRTSVLEATDARSRESEEGSAPDRPVQADAETDSKEASETESTAPEPETESPERNGLLYESLGNGTCTVAGIGNFRDACVIIPETSPAGERVVRVSQRAFLGCESVTAVQIPATVREIGSLAFADCPNLVYISVSADNAYYCDVGGVLFTADRRVLIQYPPMRAGNPAVIPASVATIPEMAFYKCVYLKNVQYEGSAEDWDRISIAPRNHSLVAAAVEFQK